MWAEIGEALWPSECAGCGGVGAGRICPACTPPGLHRVALGLPEVAGCLVLAGYDSGLGVAVARAKARGDRALMVAVGDRLAAALAPWLAEAGVTAIVPAPSARWSLLRRGFSGASVIARRVGRRGRSPVRELLRRHGGARQSSLSLAARAANLRGRVRCEVPLAGRVLLIDDVVTTGATAQACARELLGAGAREVWVAAVCAVRAR